MRPETIAARQHGLVSRAQALECGLSEGQIKRRLSAGIWQIVRPGVYAVAGMPPAWEQAVCAVVLCCRDVLASHWTAARLLGCRVPWDVDRIEVTGPNPRWVRLPGVVGHRSYHLFDPDRTRRLFIACTSPARLIVDLSGRLDARALGRVCDDLQRRKLLRLGEVARCVKRLPQAPGRSPKTVHEMLARRWAGYVPGDSDFETRVLRLIAGAGLPLPRQQYRVVVQGKRRYIDLCYPEIMLAIEVQGPVHDTAWQEDYDAIRGNELVLLGWRVLEITLGMTDEEIVDQIRRAGIVGAGQFSVMGAARTRSPEEDWSPSAASRVIVMVGKSRGETPAHSTTSSPSLNDPIATRTSASFLSHAW